MSNTAMYLHCFVFFALSPGIATFMLLSVFWGPDTIPSPYFLTLPGIILSCLMAVGAHRLQFRRYEFQRAATPLALFVCSMLFLPGMILRFLDNWRRIRNGDAKPREPGTRPSFWTFDFYTIPFSLFFFVLYAMAIPGLFQDRLRANEATAVACLRSYWTAQNIHKKMAAAPNAPEKKTAYCDKYPNLFYEKGPDGKRLALIPNGHADAYAGAMRENSIPGKPNDEAKPYQGYVYLEDPIMSERGDWNKDFALVAYPEKPGKTGNSLFWIDASGEVLRADVAGEWREGRLLDASESPLAENSALPWMRL